MKFNGLATENDQYLICMHINVMSKTAGMEMMIHVNLDLTKGSRKELKRFWFGYQMQINLFVSHKCGKNIKSLSGV